MSMRACEKYLVQNLIVDDLQRYPGRFQVIWLRNYCGVDSREPSSANELHVGKP